MDIRHGRWRGQMPFRRNRRLWTETLAHQERTGEPFLARVRWLLDRAEEIHHEEHGKASGSFTEHVREELHSWLTKNGLGWASPITFEYRLYRRRVIAVTITCPRIYHRKVRGDGSKGFMLEGRLVSIDGIPAIRTVGEFALSRIIGRHPLRLLVEGDKLGS